MIKVFIFKKENDLNSTNFKNVKKGHFYCIKMKYLNTIPFAKNQYLYHIKHYRDKVGLMKQTHCAYTGTLMVGLQNAELIWENMVFSCKFNYTLAINQKSVCV